jgi:hypothetical protein
MEILPEEIFKGTGYRRNLDDIHHVQLYHRRNDLVSYIVETVFKLIQQGESPLDVCRGSVSVLGLSVLLPAVITIRIINTIIRFIFISCWLVSADFIARAEG